jgi:cytochrome c oxidase assembly protein subunit 15
MASTGTLHLRASSLRLDARSGVRLWLIVMAGLIFVMVLVGGATRLTESGLSITEWKPVTGVVPPLSDADWQAEFDRYKQIPQFAQLNSDMTVEGFKTLYWWEWSHRLLARIVGAAFIIPALWFWIRGQLWGALGRQVAVAAGLLALEPIVGWWMVTSGLSERSEVAQERLALHLLIAAATFGALIYGAVGLGERNRSPASRVYVISAAGLVALVYAQLGLGALVAGLRAGLIYNTWPLMGSRFLPSEAFPAPSSRAMLDDPATAQFDHRMIAYAIVLFALLQAIVALRTAPSALARRAAFIGGFAALQAGLGVMTLLLLVPIALALAHQAAALILLGLAVWHWRATEMEQTAWDRRRSGSVASPRSGITP